jgi:hypothetical protein
MVVARPEDVEVFARYLDCRGMMREISLLHP